MFSDARAVGLIAKPHDCVRFLVGCALGHVGHVGDTEPVNDRGHAHGFLDGVQQIAGGAGTGQFAGHGHHAGGQCKVSAG